MRKNILGISAVLLCILLNLTSCSHTVKRSDGVSFQSGSMVVDHDSFPGEVLDCQGHVLVLFFNRQFSPSRQMENLFDSLVASYDGKAKFCKFPWDIHDDGAPYDLQKMPTVVLYKNGIEVDRIKGIQPDPQLRLKMKDDIDLWFMKNVLELKGSKYGGKFSYMFNGSYKLHITNK